jgi:DNA replication protein DnaC
VSIIPASHTEGDIRRTARTRLAHLPFQRTLDQFGFRFQPSLDERQIKELATLAFVGDAANVILLGPPRSSGRTAGV